MISVIIPTYKNTLVSLTNLKKNIPHLKDCEIIIVNDDPEISIENELLSYSAVKLIENEKNLGFAGAINRGVREASGEYLLLLNSDVVLHNDHFKRALEHFEKDPSLFAVSFAQVEKNKKTVGKNKLYWKKGFVRHKASENKKFGETAWAEGGSSIFSKEKFLNLGGFDELYSPFYWEDIDLSYRAWKAGFTVLFDPSIIVTHHHESTIGKYFSSKYVKKISYRNQLIFIWKNITSVPLLVSHFLRLPVFLLLFTLKGEFMFIKGCFGAIVRIGSILKTRNGIKKDSLKSDEEIFDLFKRE